MTQSEKILEQMLNIYFLIEGLKRNVSDKKALEYIENLCIELIKLEKMFFEIKKEGRKWEY